ncbi:MAG: ABC transporter permease [Rhodobacter sp.]|nr:ABC transporter permease [Paracoccaceae bacterium]MCC0076878.1 ABC transporter permease [Rhodobacter sp.]
MLWETFRLALRAIRRNALRSFLTVLGVVIGVAAVIAMVTVGQGSSAQVSSDIESLGTNVLMLRPGRQRMGPPSGDAARPFREADAVALAELPEVAVAAPVANSSQTVVFGNQNHLAAITGSTSDYLTVGSWEILRGRSFTPTEERSGAAVCIIGETVRQMLFGNTDPTGSLIRIRTVSCEVIGLLAAKGAAAFGQDQDDVVIMPLRTLQRRLSGNTDVPLIMLALEDGVSSTAGIRAVETLMRERRRLAPDEDNDFSITDTKQIASMLTGVNSVLTGLLSSVAAVSLLVGGIGIMNIMLVSVTERTREIGIRMAIGAQGRQVLMQFLVEAVVLSVIGGLIGIILGLVLAAVASHFMAIPFSPDPLVVLLAFVFSAVVGVVFGYVPARRAARLDPIEALRRE